MRVLTAAMPLAESADQLLSSCDIEALACLIVHKTITTAAEQGVRDARQMLFDWLALVAAAAAERGNVQREVRVGGGWEGGVGVFVCGCGCGWVGVEGGVGGGCQLLTPESPGGLLS